MLQIIESSNARAFLNGLSARQQEVSRATEQDVLAILESVKTGGDKALRDYTLRFDKVTLSDFQLPKEACKEAFDGLKPALQRALLKAAENIKSYHEKQHKDGFSLERGNGCTVGQRVRGLSKVGIYVPGGSASYPSSVLMSVIPAKVAGVSEVIMVTPPTAHLNKAVLAAAYIAGVDRILTVGGAQAVAALAYGTESIPQVDKIVGPGNIFVATAKRLLYGTVDIDMVAGPSEICIIADESANERFVAADLLSQAEHDKLASAMLLTTSQTLAAAVQKETARMAAALSRSEIITASLRDFGAIVLCDSLEDCAALANRIAPEHLEICTSEPEKLAESIQNAGAIFLGHYTPEPLGDYMAGPSHTLPTSGSARFFSPLSVDSFLKKTSIISYAKEGLAPLADDIVLLAEEEELTAHANSVSIRFGTDRTEGAI